MHDHSAPAHDVSWAALLPTAGALLLAASYLLLVHRAARAGRRPWPRRRTASFLTGCALLAAALLPPIAPWAHEDFRGHMLQHLLIGMYAPLALVLGAPITVLLRALPARDARTLTRLLRGRPMGLLAHPLTALALSNGSLAVLYFTPLYETLAAHPAGHWLLHAHFLAAGCLFAWVIAGRDPAPARPGVRTRLVVLGAAIAAHSVISQLMYGGYFLHVHAPIAQIRGGAEIMYYGGDIAELLLAAALVATWRPAPRRTIAPAPPMSALSLVRRSSATAARSPASR